MIDVIIDQFPMLQKEKKDEFKRMLQFVIEEDKKLTKEEQYEKVKNLLGEYTNGLTNKFMEFLQKRLSNNEFISCVKDFEKEFIKNDNVTKEDQLLMQAVISANRIRYEDAVKNEQQFTETLIKKRAISDLVRASKHIKI